MISDFNHSPIMVSDICSYMEMILGQINNNLRWVYLCRASGLYV